MFDFYGMKWPRTFEFVTIQKSVAELKATIFALGGGFTLLTIVLGLLYDADFELYSTFFFTFSVLLLLFSSWMEDYLKFSVACKFLSNCVIVVFSLFLTATLLYQSGVTVYTLFNAFIWVYAAIICVMTFRPLLAKRT